MQIGWVFEVGSKATKPLKIESEWEWNAAWQSPGGDLLCRKCNSSEFNGILLELDCVAICSVKLVESELLKKTLR